MFHVKVEGLDELTRKIDPRQTQFVVAKTLTQLAQAAAKELPQQAERDLDRPTAFTKGAFYAIPARKGANPQAVVAVRSVAEKYLAKQVFGGVVRGERNDRLKLPSEYRTDPFGNIPRGEVKRLVSRAMAGKRVTKMQAKRTGISRNVDLFYGEPKGWPLGLYKRTPNGLIPIIVFPKQEARYKPRFKFFETVQRTVRESAEAEFEAAWEFALRTAR